MLSSIRFKIIAPVVALVLAVISVFTWYWSSRFIQALDENFERELSLTTEFISPPLTAAVWDFDQGRADSALGGLDGLAGYVFARVYSDGDAFAERSHNGEWNDAWTSVLDQIDASGAEPQRIAQNGFEVVATPLMLDDGGQAGVFVLGATRSHIEAAQAELMTLSLIIGGAAFALMGLLTYAIAMSVVKPLSRVTGMINQVTNGVTDFETTDTDRKDEIGLIANAVEVFRAKALEVAELHQQQEETRAQAEAERKEMLASLKGAVGAVVGRAVEGDFSSRVDVALGDETLDELASDVNQLCQSVDDATQAIKHMLGDLAGGDLTVRIDGAYRGVFEDLQNDANATAEKLQTTVLQIHETTASMTSMIDAIADGSNDLSSRTEEQAGELEEAAATMEEMSATIQNNAVSSNNARSLADDTSETAVEGGKIAADAVGAMRLIEESATKISDITGLVDSIAFQTNLLALNAAVEAARAGDAGKGFAVVASEVRTLAQRAGDAASEIKALISESVEKVAGGVRFVEGTGDTLERIRGGASELSSAIADISNASSEQSVAVNEITSTINAIDSQTQRNSALASESASNATHLRNETMRLNRLMAFFNAGDQASAPRHPVVAPETHQDTAWTAHAETVAGGDGDASASAPNPAPAPMKQAASNDGSWAEF